MENISEHFVSKMSLWKVFIVWFIVVALMFFGMFGLLLPEPIMTTRFFLATSAVGFLMSAMFTSLFSLTRSSMKVWAELKELKDKVNAAKTEQDLYDLVEVHKGLRKKSCHNYHSAELSTIWQLMEMKLNTIKSLESSK